MDLAWHSLSELSIRWISNGRSTTKMRGGCETISNQAVSEEVFHHWFHLREYIHHTWKNIWKALWPRNSKIYSQTNSRAAQRPKHQNHTILISARCIPANCSFHETEHAHQLVLPIHSGHHRQKIPAVHQNFGRAKNVDRRLSICDRQHGYRVNYNEA